MRRLLDKLYTYCLYTAGGLLCGLCLLVLYSIAVRLLGFYGSGASDIAGYLMATCTFLALAGTFRANGHIYVSLIISRLPPRAKKRVSLAAHGIMFAAAAYLAFYLARLTYFSYQFEERSEGADALLLWIVQLPVTIGAALFAVAVLHSTIDLWAGKAPPQGTQQPAQNNADKNIAA